MHGCAGRLRRSHVGLRESRDAPQLRGSRHAALSPYAGVQARGGGVLLRAARDVWARNRGAAPGTSTSSAAQDPNSQYAAVVPRLHRRRALHGEPPTIYGDGGQTRDFVYVRQRRAREPARHPRAARAGAGSVVQRRCGQASVHDHVGQPGRERGGRAAEVCGRAGPGEVRNVAASIEKARRARGIRPARVAGFREGLRADGSRTTGTAARNGRRGRPRAVGAGSLRPRPSSAGRHALEHLPPIRRAEGLPQHGPVWRRSSAVACLRSGRWNPPS